MEQEETRYKNYLRKRPADDCAESTYEAWVKSLVMLEDHIRALRREVEAIWREVHGAEVLTKKVSVVLRWLLIFAVLTRCDASHFSKLSPILVSRLEGREGDLEHERHIRTKNSGWMTMTGWKMSCNLNKKLQWWPIGEIFDSIVSLLVLHTDCTGLKLLSFHVTSFLFFNTPNASLNDASQPASAELHSMHLGLRATKLTFCVDTCCLGNH